MMNVFGSYGVYDPYNYQGAYGQSLQDQMNQYYKARLAQLMPCYPQVATVAGTQAVPEVRKALPVVEEFEWLRNRVNELLWKPAKV